MRFLIIINLYILCSCSTTIEEKQVNKGTYTFAQEFVFSEHKTTVNDNFLKLLKDNYDNITLYMDSTIVVNPQFKKVETTKYYFSDSLKLVRKIDSEKWKDNLTLTDEKWDKDGTLISKKRFKNDSIISELKVIKNNSGVITEMIDVYNNIEKRTEYLYLNDTTVRSKTTINGEFESEVEIIVNSFLKTKSYKSFSKDGKVIQFSQNEYDINGNNTYWKSIRNGNIDGETSYKFDSKNRVIEQIDFLESEDYYTNHEKLQYDSSGNIVYHYQVNQYGDTIIRTTSRSNNIEKWEKSLNGVTTKTGVIKRNEKDRVLYSSYQDSKNINETFFKYDSDNRIISQITTQNQDTISIKKYEWTELDANTKKLDEYRDGEKYQTTFYTNK